MSLKGLSSQNWRELAYQYIHTSTLHCRGKNGRSKKIGQTNQKMIHFVPNMHVSGKISALRPGTQTVMIFGTTTKIRKLPKTTRFQDLRLFACFFLCFFLRAFCGFFLRGFAGFIPSRLMRCKHFLALVSPNPKTCNQSPKIQDLGVLGKISRYRSNSENTYIFLGFRVEVYNYYGCWRENYRKPCANHASKYVVRCHSDSFWPIPGQSVDLNLQKHAYYCRCNSVKQEEQKQIQKVVKWLLRHSQIKLQTAQG